MFCPTCGREIPSDARFCNHCGAAQAVANRPEGSASVPSASARPNEINQRLRKLHTFDWKGECPSCGSVYTSETARCPNDGSSLVVAFDTSGWNPASLYIYSAELRCVNCGFRSNAITCEDNTVINGSRISFSFPPARMFIYNTIHILAVLLGLALVAPGFFVVFRWLFRWVVYREPMDILDLTDYPYPFFTAWPGGWILFWSWLRWWPFRSRFTFEDVEKRSA